jgi:hypothetical protein
MKEFIRAAVGADHMTPQEKSLFGKMLFTYGWRLSAFTFALWSLGAFKSYNLGGGFAFHDPTEAQNLSVEKRLTSIERRQLEQSIMETLKEGCAQPNKDYFRARLNEQQQDYSERYKGRLPVPTCEQLGILPNG